MDKRYNIINVKTMEIVERNQTYENARLMVQFRSDANDLKIVPAVTETIKIKVVNYRGLFLDFKGMAFHGYANSPKADAKICFTLGMMCGIDKEESERLMVYLLENWYAWTMDIINGTYKYVNLTETVYSSWLEYKAKRG